MFFTSAILLNTKGWGTKRFDVRESWFDGLFINRLFIVKATVQICEISDINIHCMVHSLYGTIILGKCMIIRIICILPNVGKTSLDLIFKYCGNWSYGARYFQKILDAVLVPVDGWLAWTLRYHAAGPFMADWFWLLCAVPFCERIPLDIRDQMHR